MCERHDASWALLFPGRQCHQYSYSSFWDKVRGASVGNAITSSEVVLYTSPAIRKHRPRLVHSRTREALEELLSRRQHKALRRFCRCRSVRATHRTEYVASRHS